MAQHKHKSTQPGRVVVLGSTGFMGQHLMEELRRTGLFAIGLGSRSIDLAAPQAVDALRALLKPGDAVVFASCLTPDKGKDIRTMMRNLAMGEHVCAALAASACDHVIYVSSDAVYADAETLVREDSRCEPSTLYGIMHFARERMVRQTAEGRKIPCLIARPTLLYGHGDTHNSYGPNRFARQAATEGVIKLFGNGEEKRDHVYIGDVARLLTTCLEQRTTGIVNIATGVSTSFDEVARMVVKAMNRPVNIERLPRSGPVTHRYFDGANLARMFPEFSWTPLAAGFAQAYGQRQAA
jgi:UDP-glucose 4-epimerase